jgi:AhpD family alkylhydroperoxidase
MNNEKFSSLKEFQHYREKMNKAILDQGNIVTKRFFNLDSKGYEEGTLDVKTKELLGLVASTVLRCDDCITYHIIRSIQENVNQEEFFETMNIALIVGGSIVIPHFRRAVERFNECLDLHRKGVDLNLASPSKND